MFDRLTDEARWVVRRAQDHAREEGAAAIGSEHLLIALSERDGTPAQRVLTDAGMTTEGLHELVHQERDRSLRFAGIDPTPVPTSPRTSSPRLATSAKNVLRRAVTGSRRSRGRIDTVGLLRAVLDQRAGTAPRLFALAGVDRNQLLEALASQAT